MERCLNHGNSWSIYCRDPEGNRLELYAASPWYVSQPFAHPLDLSQPIEEIMAATESLARQDPSFKPMSEWSAEMREKIARLE